MTAAGTRAARKHDEKPARHRRSLCHAILLGALAASPARAEPGPSWAGGLAFTTGYGGHLADFHFGLRLELGGFFRRGPWQATLSLPFTFTTSDAVDRDGHRIDDVGVGLRVGYHRMLVEHVAGSVSLGLERQWLSGSDIVTRECQVTHTCIAGFYMETASYRAWVPQLRIGAGLEEHYPTVIAAAMGEVIVEYARIAVPGRELSGIAVLVGITGTIGGGTRRATIYH